MENPSQENIEQPEKDKKINNCYVKYEKLFRIGDGYFGTVFKVKGRETEQLYAVKEILESSLVNTKTNKITKEIEIINNSIIKIL